MFTGAGRILVLLLYFPALILGLARVMILTWDTTDLQLLVRIVTVLDRIDLLYLALCLVAGAAVLARALTEVRSITARRQLRWIAWGTTLGAAPFAVGYAVPYAAGVDPSLTMQLSAVPLSLIPLAFASAIVRYRLMDIEVIVKQMLQKVRIIDPGDTNFLEGEEVDKVRFNKENDKVIDEGGDPSTCQPILLGEEAIEVSTLANPYYASALARAYQDRVAEIARWSEG